MARHKRLPKKLKGPPATLMMTDVQTCAETLADAIHECDHSAATATGAGGRAASGAIQLGACRRTNEEIYGESLQAKGKLPGNIED